MEAIMKVEDRASLSETDLFKFIRERVRSDTPKSETLTKILAEYAALYKISFAIVQDEYNKGLAERTKIRQRFDNLLASVEDDMNRKFLELEKTKSPLGRLYEPWEKEIMELAGILKPELNKTHFCKYLEEIMPHRSWKSWMSYIQREEVKKTEEQRKEDKKIITPVRNTQNAKFVVAHKPKIGDIVEGTVTKIIDCGAIIVTNSDQRGLLHVSEIADEYVGDINDYLFLGQKITAKIITDKDGRISFSTRRLGSISKENTRMEREKNFVERVTASDHRIDKQRRLAEGLIKQEDTEKGFKMADIIPTELSTMLSERMVDVGDDLIHNLDAVILRLEENLKTLKDTRAKFLEKEQRYGKLESLRKTLSELL